jgi:hypothetical protein
MLLCSSNFKVPRLCYKGYREFDAEALTVQEFSMKLSKHTQTFHAEEN